MPLALRVRKPNHIAVVECTGRIVAGEEATSLESEVRKHVNNRCDVVLNLSGIAFVDSSGLGLLVRLATSSRKTTARVRFCSPVPAVERVIKMTLLDRVLQPYATEEQAISSLAERGNDRDSLNSVPGDILCADGSPDILSYLREGLGQLGYRVHSAAVIPDALLLLKAMRPRLLIAGPRFGEKLAARALDMKVPMIQLSEDFNVADAGQALERLVSEIKERLI
jgi:anti-sigma B factor antagonist